MGVLNRTASLRHLEWLPWFSELFYHHTYNLDQFWVKFSGYKLPQLLGVGKVESNMLVVVAIEIHVNRYHLARCPRSSKDILAVKG